MSHPSFSDLAHHLVAHHPPKTDEVARDLGQVRAIFDDAVDRLSLLVPPGADASVAARAIGDACQATIAAIVRNQADA